MSSCSFCNAKLKTSEGYDVKGVVIDQNPGIIKLTDVLLDLYFCEVTDSLQFSPQKSSINFLFSWTLQRFVVNA